MELVIVGCVLIVLLLVVLAHLDRAIRNRG
jgi:hypothetical protein